MAQITTQIKLSALVLLTAVSLSSSLQAASAFKFPPPQNMMARQEPMQEVKEAPQNAESQTVIELVNSNPSLSSLARALKAADLDSTLQGEGPFTLFAPNDQAFAKLSPNALADLLKNKTKLASILTYHVVPGKLTASEIKSGQVKTVNGKALNIAVTDGEITVNNAKVMDTDLEGSNGLIYVIDTVLIP
jgi:uncharacterized surface protein with fasciclin (FAS1) repeats